MGSCGATCGITRAREREKDAARAAARSAPPSGHAPLDDDELAEVAREFESLLPARCVVTAAGDGAAFVYVVATTEDATWVALREGLSEAQPAAPEQRALRVGFSPRGRFATLQEVSLRGELLDDGAWVEEARARGVEDRRLQAFVRAAQGALRARKVTVLDAAFLAEEVSPGGGTVWSALFEADSPVTTRGDWVPR